MNFKAVFTLAVAMAATVFAAPTRTNNARSVDIYQPEATAASPTASSGTIKNQAAMDAYNAQNYQRND
ncbi:hypothetical protein E3P99_00206 [Wallemia hederae]|uniref:Uncharacterized protein n=1 Tax=Wallemia hederae TaxID=1540922 RepID=A0A4T0FY67_9BASI|nr:hypothetical protein E3P99_00206 [Wallemia hederae]